MENDVFYVLSGEEVLNISHFSVLISEIIMGKYPTLAHSGLVKEGFDRLKNKMLAMDATNPVDVPLDWHETAALESSIIHTSLSMNEKKFTSENEEENEFFQFYRREAPELLWQLVKQLEYNDFGLTILEDIYHYDTKMVKPLVLDNIEEIAAFDYNEFHQLMYNWLFGTIDAIELNHEKYDFGRRIHEHQYINLKDYNEYKEKMKALVINTEVPMTMRDIVIQYWVFSLAQRLYVTDAAKYMDEIEKGAPEGSFEILRTSFLHFAKSVIEAIDANFEEVEEIEPYLKMVDKWEFEIDM
ncbi:MAG: hypothetical protein Q8909_01590 [Bacteroidota bacterium]|nr:hypothetical protein [Bacteroidota bacterium]